MRAKRATKTGPAAAPSEPAPAAAHHHAHAREHNGAVVVHEGARSVSRKALIKELVDIRKSLGGLYQASHRILSNTEGPGTELYKEICLLKRQAHNARREANEEWKKENEDKLKEMTAYIEEKKKNPSSRAQNPHPGIHGEHMLHLHSQTIRVKPEHLQEIHAKVQAMVKKFGLPPSATEMTCELPIHVPNEPQMFYIYPIIRYAARETYRYVSAIDNKIRRIVTEDRTEEESDYYRTFNQITTLKRRQSEARRALAEMRKSKPHKPRKPLPQMPDNGNPPRQVAVHNPTHERG